MSYVLSMPISDEHVQKVHELAKKLREDPTPGKHNAEMVTVSLEAVTGVMEYMFIEPLNRVNAGAFARKGATMGIKTGLKMFSKVAKGSFLFFIEKQLVEFADWREEGPQEVS